MTELRERILIAAIDEFGKKGLKFTMDDISKNLGISKKTLYNVYDSKESMFLDLADYSFADIKKSEKQIMDDPDMDVLTKIEKIMVVLPERYQNIGLNNLYQLKEKYPNIYKRVENYLETDWDATIELLKQGMDEGKIRKISIPVLQAMIEGAYQQFLTDSILVENQIGYEEALQEMISIVINGIRKD